MAHWTRNNHRKLTEMAPEPDCILQKARLQMNKTSLPAVGPFTLVEAVPRSDTSQDDDRLLHLLNETRRATIVEERRIQEEDPLDDPPSVTDKNIEIVL